MAPQVSGILAGVAASDVDQLAIEYASAIRPRREHSTSLWRLLEAALGSGDGALDNIPIHCLQLLGNDLILSYGSVPFLARSRCK
jgi:hypothetical protein